ncbi:MAG TPA: phage integrase N-terminal SAM-like domain-containing protein, partial [Anaerolineae bacterium]
MKLSQAADGYFLAAEADGYSPLTLRAYRSALNILIAFLGDPELDQVSTADIRQFFAHIRNTYQPKRPSGNTEPLSTASIHRYWKAVRSFYKWAGEELKAPRPDLTIKMPRYTNKEITPFTEDELRKLLHACEAIEATSEERGAYQIRRPTRHRDRAIMLVLIDTGMRAGELSRLKVKNLNLENGELRIEPHHVRKTRARTARLGS